MNKKELNIAPCLQCAANGIEFNKENSVCQKCNYFILVSIVSKIVEENTNCEYCIRNGKCTGGSTCEFELNFEKLFSDYTDRNFKTDNNDSNTEVDLVEELCSEKPTVQSFSEDEELLENSIDDLLNSITDYSISDWLDNLCN